MKILLTIVLILGYGVSGYAQTDPSIKKEGSGIFKRMEEATRNYQLDTTAVPEDRLTNEIRKLRIERGGFNINELLELKLNNSHPLIAKQLENAVIWIYRRHFTLREAKRLVRFYRTPAGKKLADRYPIIMVETIRAADLMMPHP